MLIIVKDYLQHTKLICPQIQYESINIITSQSQKNQSPQNCTAKPR